MISRCVKGISRVIFLVIFEYNTEGYLKGVLEDPKGVLKGSQGESFKDSEMDSLRDS